MCAVGERWWTDENQNRVEDAAAQACFATKQQQRRHCYDADGSYFNAAEVCDQCLHAFNFIPITEGCRKAGYKPIFFLSATRWSQRIFQSIFHAPCLTRENWVFIVHLIKNYCLLHQNPLRMCSWLALVITNSKHVFFIHEKCIYIFKYNANLKSQ